MIPLFKVFMSKYASQRVAKVLSSGYIGEGPLVKEFEDAISHYIGNPNVVCVNSCTSALILALRLSGVRVGDFVATTPMTCLATNEAILALGAHPVWVEVDADTGNMSHGSLKTVLRIHKGIRAVICVHWGGFPCDVQKINDVAREWGIPVIEDAAHAFGTEIDHTKIGNHSDFVCFSFQAIKTVTCGDGGALLASNADVAKRARLMRWFGLDRELSSDMRCCQDPVEFGYKMQMTDIDAAIGISNLMHVDGILKTARENAQYYDDAFENMMNVRVVSVPKNINPSRWLYTVTVNDAPEFIAHMRNRGVACSKVHDRNDTKTIFDGSRCSLPGVASFDKDHVCIPVGWWVTKEQRDHIINSVKEYEDG